MCYCGFICHVLKVRIMLQVCPTAAADILNVTNRIADLVCNLLVCITIGESQPCHPFVVFHYLSGFCFRVHHIFSLCRSAIRIDASSGYSVALMVPSVLTSSFASIVITQSPIGLWLPRYDTMPHRDKPGLMCHVFPAVHLPRQRISQYCNQLITGNLF